MYLLLLVYSYKSSGASLISTALWYYLGTKHLDFRHENNSTPGVLIEDIQYVHMHTHMVHIRMCMYTYVYV